MVRKNKRINLFQTFLRCSSIHMAAINFKLLAFCIILIFDYCRAKCELDEFDYIREDEEGEVMKQYIDSRTSWKQFISNIIRGRLYDPICTEDEETLTKLCDCIYDKAFEKQAPSKKKKKEGAKKVIICEWKTLAYKTGRSSFYYGHLYTCDVDNVKFSLMQGYEALETDVYNVYVVEVSEKLAQTHVIKGVAKEIDFSKIDKATYGVKLMMQLLMGFFNLCKLFL